MAIRLVAAAGPDLSPIDRAEVLVEAHAMRGDLEEVERLVASVWDDDLEDDRRAHLSKRLADTRFYRDRDLAGALAAHEAARARITAPDALAAVDARRASLLAGAGRPAEALATIEAMGPVTSARTRAEADGALATSLLSLGRFTEARAVARRAAVDHAGLPDWLARRGITQHLLNEAHALAYAGNYADARAILEPAAERARATGATGAWVWMDMALAEIARDTGRAEEAVRRFAEVAAAAPRVGQHAALVWAHVGVAQGHLLQGRCDEAAVALERADEAGDSPVATSVATRERARAWLDACRGDLASARERIRETVEPVRHDGMAIFELALLHDLVRLGRPDEVVDRLEVLAERVDGPLAAIHAANARALVDGDADALRSVVDRYEEIDALALAAEVAAELAELLRRRSEARAATAAAQRAAELADRAGGLRTPVLGRGAGVEPLTPREREVALLAAAGRTSRAIGDHLGLSTRTVDTHLARAYRKLGITGRTELTDALGG
jgi:DNA-binding CsgD family transcriptional regulator